MPQAMEVSMKHIHNKDIEIPWFNDYHPRKVGVIKKTGRGGKPLYRLRFRLPTGEECNPKAGTNADEAHRFARSTHHRLIRQDWTAEERSKIIQALGLDQEPEPDRLSLQDSLELFQTSVLRGVTDNTARSTTSLLKQIGELFARACPDLHDLDDLTPEAIEAVLNIKKQMPIRRQGVETVPDDISVDNLLRMIRRWCKWLVERDKLAKDPALRVKYLCSGGQKARTVVPHDTKILRIYEELSKPEDRSKSSSSPLRSIIEFLIETGARRSEVLCLEWTDIEDGRWHIREKVCADGYRFTPKSSKSTRCYVLTDEMREILERQPKVSPFVFPKQQVRLVGCPVKRVRPGKTVSCGTCPLERNRFSCEFRTVTYSRISSIDTAWTNLRKKADALDITLHDLRRYANEKLLQQGLSYAEAGAIIGNSAVVNRKHYDPHRDQRLHDQATQKRLQMGRLGPDFSVSSEKK